MSNLNNKYILSPQRRANDGLGNGTYIIIPNRSYNDNMLFNIVRPLASLLNRVCI